MPKHELIKQIPTETGLEYGWTDKSKPERTDNRFKSSDNAALTFVESYDKALFDWKKSITWTKVRDEDEWHFTDLAFKSYKGPMFMEKFSEALADMIEIPEGLVGLKKEYEYDDNDPSPLPTIGVIYPYIIKPKAGEETDQELEDRTIRNIKIVADFMEHCKEEGFEIPEQYFESFFNA